MDELKPDIIKLVVEFDPANGQINITGPTDNLPLLFGMMETAKFVVMQERIVQKKVPSIIPGVTPFDPNLLKQRH